MILEQPENVPGAWRDVSTGDAVEDESRKYTVIISRDRVDVLKEILVRAANSFDQKEILFMVQGVDCSVQRDPSKGFLKGDPAQG